MTKIYISDINPPRCYTVEVREGKDDNITVQVKRGSAPITSGAAFLRGETEADLLQAISYATRSAFVNYVRKHGIDLKTVALETGESKKEKKET